MLRFDSRPHQIAALTRINITDMLESLGLAEVRHGKPLLRILCWPAARHFARQVACYDAHVGVAGLRAGAEFILQRHVWQVEVGGLEHVPRTGPLLVVANHPGLTDATALFLSLPRSDLRIVAADRPFLRALPHTRQQLIFTPDESHQRYRVLRTIIRHLRDGGAILTFPGGDIEPDPAVLPGAVEALSGWSESVGLLVRLAPDLCIVPAIVSSVLSAQAQRHPLTRLRRQAKERERLGALMQVLVPAYRAVTVRVAFGTPLAAADLLATTNNARAITRLVVAQAQRLIESPPTDWQPALHSHQ